MEFTVEMTMNMPEPITEDTLMDVAAVGGAATGRVGDLHLATIMTIEAPGLREAAAEAVRFALKKFRAPVVAMEVMTIEEADRRAAVRPKLVGVTEVAKILGVSKQRVSVLSRRDDFPAPVERLTSGPVWRAGDLSTFKDGWQRKAGRPRKAVEAEA